MTGTETTDTASRRSFAGFFSSASTFSLPHGSQYRPGEIGGYYIDLRSKADAPGWRPDWLLPPSEGLFVASAQWGLACYEHWLATGEQAWLASARDCAEEILSLQEREGPLRGGFRHDTRFWHTFKLDPPWRSAMAQGEAASLFVRVHRETGDERFAEGARLALGPLAVGQAEGGVRAELGGRGFPEEYPTDPPSFVLNGAIFTLWGVHDVAVGLGDEPARELFEQLVDTLAGNLHRWDTGYWSRYDLFPHPVVNVASSFYHDLHVSQLRALNALSPRPQLAATAERWAGYAESRACVVRSFAHKSVFRIMVPRNVSLARRLPWSPFYRA